MRSASTPRCLRLLRRRSTRAGSAETSSPGRTSSARTLKRKTEFCPAISTAASSLQPSMPNHVTVPAPTSLSMTQRGGALSAERRTTPFLRSRKPRMLRTRLGSSMISRTCPASVAEGLNRLAAAALATPSSTRARSTSWICPAARERGRVLERQPDERLPAGPSTGAPARRRADRSRRRGRTGAPGRRCRKGTRSDSRARSRRPSSRAGRPGSLRSRPLDAQPDRAAVQPARLRHPDRRIALEEHPIQRRPVSAAAGGPARILPEADLRKHRPRGRPLCR